VLHGEPRQCYCRRGYSPVSRWLLLWACGIKMYTALSYGTSLPAPSPHVCTARVYTYGGRISLRRFITGGPHCRDKSGLSSLLNLPPSFVVDRRDGLIHAIERRPWSEHCASFNAWLRRKYFTRRRESAGSVSEAPSSKTEEEAENDEAGRDQTWLSGLGVTHNPRAQIPSRGGGGCSLVLRSVRYDKSSSLTRRAARAAEMVYGSSRVAEI